MKKKYMADIDEEFYRSLIVCNTNQLLDRL